MLRLSTTGRWSDFWASLNYAVLREHPYTTKPGDMSLIMAMTTRRRGLAEILHHIFGIALPARPRRMSTAPGAFSKYFESVVEEIRQHYIPYAKGGAECALKTLLLHAELLQNCNSIGSQITSPNLDDLSDCLSERPRDMDAGSSLLAERIKSKPSVDLARRLIALYRTEVRSENFLEPVIRACGFACGVPLERVY